MDTYTNIIVVGAGISGLSVALHLTEISADFLLVDPTPGQGASHVAAGMLAPASEVNYDEDLMGALLRKAARYWEDFSKKVESLTNSESGYERRPTMLIATERGDLDELIRLEGYHRHLNIESHLLGRLEARDTEPTLSPKVIGGLYTPMDFQVDNRKLLKSLVELFDSRKQIFRSAVTSVSKNGKGSGWTVQTQDGNRISGQFVILCNPMDAPKELLPSSLDEKLLRFITSRAVKGDILRLRDQMDQGPKVCVRSIRNGRWNYIVPRQSHEIVVGATQEESSQRTHLSAKAGSVLDLLFDATSSIPILRELSLVEVGTGLRPGTFDNYPLVGELLPGLYIHSGHYRHGFLLAPITAAALVSSLAPEPQAQDEAILVDFSSIMSPYRFQL